MKTRLIILFVGALAALGCEGTIEMLDADGNAISVIDSSVGVGDGTGPATPEMVADGRALYELYCQTCHGPEASGAAAWPGSIAGYQPIHDIVIGGRGSMAGLPLASAEVGLIQAYLLSLGFPDWSDLTGVEVYATGCASCHGAEAEGTTRGPQLRFRDAPYFDYVTRHGGWSAARWDAPMAAYTEERISDAQLAEMVAWIDAFPNAGDGEGLYRQFCANCHGGTGVRGRFEAEFEDPIAGVCRSGKEDSPRNRQYMPGWSEAEIDDNEMQALQAYVSANFASEEDD